MFKITMKIENEDGNTVEMTRNFSDYAQGRTECNVICLFTDFLTASSQICMSSIGLNLPTHFDEVELTDKYKKIMGMV